MSRHKITALILGILTLFVAPLCAYAFINFGDGFQRANNDVIGNGWTEAEVTGTNIQVSGGTMKMDSGATDALVSYQSRSSTNQVPFNGVVLRGKFQDQSATQSLTYIAIRQNTPRNTGDCTCLILVGFATSRLDVAYANGGTTAATVNFPLTVSTWYNYEWVINSDNSGTVRVWALGTQRPDKPSLTVPAFTDTTTYTQYGVDGQRTFVDDYSITVSTSTAPTMQMRGGQTKMKGGTSKLRGFTYDYKTI